MHLCTNQNCMQQVGKVKIVPLNSYSAHLSGGPEKWHCRIGLIEVVTAEFPYFSSERHVLVFSQCSEHPNERSSMTYDLSWVAVLALLWWLCFIQSGAQWRLSCFRLCLAQLNFELWLFAADLLLFLLQLERCTKIKGYLITYRGWSIAQCWLWKNIQVKKLINPK